jgi:hypothetical protein
MKLPIILLLVLLAFAACKNKTTLPATRDEITVAAYYFPNYHTDEKDPDVMALKIETAVNHGIDCFIFDWYMYEDGPFLNRCIDEGFLKANNCDRMNFGLMWANHDWFDIHPYTRGAEQKLLYPGRFSAERFDEILVLKPPKLQWIV